MGEVIELAQLDDLAEGDCIILDGDRAEVLKVEVRGQDRVLTVKYQDTGSTGVVLQGPDYRVRWFGDRIVNDPAAEEVVSKVEQLTRWRRKPDRLKAWEQISEYRAWLVGEADRLTDAGYVELPEAYREQVRQLVRKIRTGATWRQLLKMFGNAEPAKKALLIYFRDRTEEHKAMAEEALRWLTGRPVKDRGTTEKDLRYLADRPVDLEEEERIDRDHCTETGDTGKLERKARRIVERLKPD